MITVSNTWKQESGAQFRNQGYLSVNLSLEPPGLREAATASSSNSATISRPAKVLDGLSEVEQKYASLECNRWVLDGASKVPTKSTITEQWWSSATVASSAPTMTITFDKAYSIPGLVIHWDVVNNSYPTKFNFNAYNASGTPVYSDTIDYTTSSSTTIIAPLDNITKIVIQILEWSVPQWVARISEVTFGMFIDFDSDGDGRIMSATTLDSSDPLCQDLPSHSMTLTFRNFDHYFDPTLQEGISQYLAAQQILKASWGFQLNRTTREVAPEMVYIVQNFDIPSDAGSVTINFTNRLALLDNEYIYGTYTGGSRNLLSILNEVMNRSGVLTEFNGQIPWEVPNSSTMSSLTTTAPIPAKPTNAILQYIAMVSGRWLRIRSEDGFIIFDVDQSTPQPYSDITMEQQLGDPMVEVIDRLQTVSIGVHTYSLDSETKEIGKSEVVVNGTLEITIKYNVNYANSVSATVSGGTLQSATYYASYAIVTLKTTASATVTVVLKGVEIKDTITYVELYNNLAVSDGINVSVDNPFVTSTALAQKVANRVAAYYNKRTRYTAEYLGYPQLEAHDKVNFKSTFGDGVVEVVSNNITFNGGWNGNVEVI